MVRWYIVAFAGEWWILMFQRNAIIWHIAINWPKLLSLIIKNIRKIRYRQMLANGFSRSVIMKFVHDEIYWSCSQTTTITILMQKQQHNIFCKPKKNTFQKLQMRERACILFTTMSRVFSLIFRTFFYYFEFLATKFFVRLVGFQVKGHKLCLL